MTTYSKYYDACMKDISCTTLYHNNQSCIQYIVGTFIKAFPGCCKFVLPLTIIPLLMKWKQLNRNTFRESLQFYWKYVLSCWMISGFSLCSMCFYRRLFGQYRYYTSILIPGFTGISLSMSYIPPDLINLFADALFTMFLETLIRSSDRICNSKMLMTLSFMASNAIILHGLRKVDSKVIWFYKPENKISSETLLGGPHLPSPICDQIMKTEKKICQHKYNCDNYILRGVTKYLKYGIALEILRAIIKNFSQITTNPLKSILAIGKNVKINILAFLVGYVGIYRVSHCLLSRWLNQESTVGHLIASFLCGLPFYLISQTTLMAHALTIAIKVSWTTYLASSLVTKPSFVEWLNQLPINKIVLALNFAYLLHVRTFFPWLAPQMLKQFMTLTTNKQDTFMMMQYYRQLFGRQGSPPYILYLFGFPSDAKMLK